MPRTDKLASVPFLVAASLDVKSAARIRLAAPVDADDLPPPWPRASPNRSRLVSIPSPAPFSRAAAAVWAPWC